MSRSNPPAIVRANNPCALRLLSRGRWKHQSGTIHTKGGLYCAFTEPLWGVRAGLRNLDTYRRVHGLLTPSQIIGRWAPAHDSNPQSAYARFVARRIGSGVHEPIPEDYDTLRRLIAAIIRFECGYDAVGPEVIAQAMAVMAAEEQAQGRDPSAYLAQSAPLKPLTHSREIALGGGAATIGIGGAVGYGRDAVDAARDAIGAEPGVAVSAVDTMKGAVGSAGELACIGSFLILVLFGLAVLANRLRARRRAER